MSQEPTTTRLDTGFHTHEVTNQAKPHAQYTTHETDVALKDAIALQGANWAAPELSAFSSLTGGEISAIASLLTAVGKYWVFNLWTPFVNEAQECLGGAGYVEEGMMPRLKREAPLNSIWEGSGNVQCWDVLRAISREPETLDAFYIELHQTKGLNKHLDSALIKLHAMLASGEALEPFARRIVEQIALVFQSHLLLKTMPSYVADAYCKSHLAGQDGVMFGTLRQPVKKTCLIERAFAA